MTDSHQRIVVYLLHDAAKASKQIHYVGSTTSAQWERRMADHRAGNGGATTRRLVSQGADLRCVRIWNDVTRDDERRIKRNGHLSKACPACRGELPMIHAPNPPRNAVAMVEQDPIFTMSLDQTQKRRSAS